MAEDESDEHEWHIRFKQDEEMDFFTELALHEAERWIQVIDSCSRGFKMYTRDVIICHLTCGQCGVGNSSHVLIDFIIS